MNQPEELNPLEELHLSDESFARLEQHLTQVLRPVDPPNCLAERIIARAQPSILTKAKLVSIALRWRLWTSGAIAAALLAGFFIVGQTRAYHERQKAEIAEHQFEVALRITGETLEQTSQQLQQAGIEIGD